LLGGVFLFDEWADILLDRVVKSRVAEDKKILPDVLSQVGIDITDLRTPAGISVRAFLKDRLWPSRDRFVHRGDFPPAADVATIGLECAHIFRKDVVGRLGTKLGFTLETTGKWSEVKGDELIDIIDVCVSNRH